MLEIVSLIQNFCLNDQRSLKRNVILIYLDLEHP
jgi:hypothetical protein